MINTETMVIKELLPRPNIQHNKKLVNIFEQFNQLLSELRKKELSAETIASINTRIDEINAIHDAEKTLRKKLKATQASILKSMEKQYKIVTINHYRNTWLAIGMAVFGIPMGVVFGTALGNMAFLGIGIPIGMVIGMAVGTGMDKKALEEGRQLNLEINY